LLGEAGKDWLTTVCVVMEVADGKSTSASTATRKSRAPMHCGCGREAVASPARLITVGQKPLYFRARRRGVEEAHMNAFEALADQHTAAPIKARQRACRTP